MKTLKLTRKVQIILITIFVIITGVIIVSIVSNDRLMGYADTGLGTAKSAKPIELFDSAGTNVDGLHIGDFVNYDAGTWKQDEINEIQTGPKTNLATANGSTSLPTKGFQFGGFVAGSSKNGNATPYNSSYNYIKEVTTGEAVTGWRVFDINDDGTVTLISAGNPEDYYHTYGISYAYMSEYVLTGKVNSSWSESEAENYQTRDWNKNYVNTEQYAESATVLDKSKLDAWYTKYTNTANADICDSSTFQKIYSEPYKTYQNLIDNYSYCWFSTSGNSEELWFVSPSDLRY